MSGTLARLDVVACGIGVGVALWREITRSVGVTVGLGSVVGVAERDAAAAHALSHSTTHKTNKNLTCTPAGIGSVSLPIPF
ncbi:MAG: hypothetical protein LC737_05955 [Chloroflexi bacterium]|nr:hypothetical protein [Chloroflexota bacterium]